MSLLDLFLTAVALSMDAFAVAIGKGLSMKKLLRSHAVIIGLWFGIFQALMPVLGYYLGASFRNLVASIDHWIAFILLSLIGAGMIREALSGGEEHLSDAIDARTMMLLAIATSIDAMAVGVTFAFLDVHLASAVTLIGFTTFLLSAAGVLIGHYVGQKYQQKAEIAGGIILILIGLKILLEQM